MVNPVFERTSEQVCAPVNVNQSVQSEISPEALGEGGVVAVAVAVE
jgi:hypothetical protein